MKYFTTKQIDNIFLIFMEYVAGESLFDRVERAGPLNSNLVIDFTYQILSGLVYMHSQEIVHRLVNSGAVCFRLEKFMYCSILVIGYCELQKNLTL